MTNKQNIYKARTNRVNRLKKWNVFIARKTYWKFVLSELASFTTLTILLLITLLVKTRGGKDQDGLIEYIKTHVNGDSLFELGTFSVITIAIFGLLNAYLFPSQQASRVPKHWNDFAQDLLNQIPSAIYLFGAGITVSFIIVVVAGFFSATSNSIEVIKLAGFGLLAYVETFFFAFNLKYWFNKRLVKK